MPVNSVAENVLGTIGTICWTAQLVPQVWKSWREKSTAGLSPWLVLLWGISAVFLGVYVVVQNLNIPLILQPQLFGTLCLISWGQCQYYDKKRSRKVATMMAAGIIILMGGLEVAMVFAVRPSFHKGNGRAVQFFGIFSSVLISLALLPQYYEIYKRKEVIGISILFMLVDMLGGVFSDLSLVFKEEFDIIASITYSLVVVLDGLVVLAAIILNPRARRRRARQAEIEDLPTATTSVVALNTSEVTPAASPSSRVVRDSASSERKGMDTQEKEPDSSGTEGKSTPTQRTDGGQPERPNAPARRFPEFSPPGATLLATGND